jgi:hypothetical protein
VIVYNTTFLHRSIPSAKSGDLRSIPLLGAPGRAPQYVALDRQRRDNLRASVERAQQRAEDYDEEVARLQRARDAIVRPKGLGWGLVVLGFFTIVGVIVPIWIMSRAPKRLTNHLGEVVFYLFLAGLLALLAYMSLLALRLSGWWKDRKMTHRGRTVSSTVTDEITQAQQLARVLHVVDGFEIAADLNAPTVQVDWTPT